MRRRLANSLYAAALTLVLFNGPAFACGPFALEAIFTFTVHPQFSSERFALGKIGVVQPSYARSYLYVAYRELAGNPFNEKERRSLTELWKDRLEYRWELGDQEWIKEWLTARQKVPGLPEPPKIDVYRSREKPNEYETYLNCKKDAFATAAATLNDRIAKYGLENPALKDWIEGQDQVFANCSEGLTIPAAAPSTADTLARADRTYQIAAANFYAGNFDEAAKLFASIAGDDHSPWQAFAPYLLARTLVRKASLGAPETKQQSLSEAENQLQRILADRKLSDLHAGATRLLDIVRNRLHPAERLHELARLLVTKNRDEGLKQELWDYTVLLDNFLEPEGSENKSQPADQIRSDELTDWIACLQSPTTQALDHSLARWQSTHAATWLVAVLSKVEGRNPRAADLVSQAMSIKPGSPAFASARFHAVRLMIESGRGAEARVLLDELLTTNRSRFDDSSLNLLTSKRMLLATSLREFLTHAPRSPAGFSWNDDGREIPAEASDLPEEDRALQGKLLFDGDAAQVFNLYLPLATFKEAATSTILPTHLRRDVVQAAWLRAVLLGDNKTADELVPTLKSLVPELSPLLDDFLSSSQSDAKKFSAIYAWLKFPGLEPVVDSGIGRTTPLGQQDMYRDNWWCSAASSSVPDKSGEETKDQAQPFTAATGRAPAFLTASERTTAAREHLALNPLGAAPNYLCQQVVQWVSRNPSEPRAPEALHLAVNTTRYGCTDKATGRWSKAAYDLLHRKYPNTTWAKKTPYWFKD
jgi:hypothetical protein